MKYTYTGFDEADYKAIQSLIPYICTHKVHGGQCHDPAECITTHIQATHNEVLGMES